MINCWEARMSMLSNYFGKKPVHRGTFMAIWRVQTQMYPQTSFEPKYVAFHLKNSPATQSPKRYRDTKKFY